MGCLARRGCQPPADRLTTMDLSVFFAGTAGSIPTARRGLPALLVRRGGDRILFDCGEGTQRQLVQLRRAGRPHRDLPDPLPRRSLARAARAAEDVRPARARAAARDPRTALACGSCSRSRCERRGGSASSSTCRARTRRYAGTRRLPDRAGPGRPPRAGAGLRDLRGRAPGRVRPRRGGSASACARARSSGACSGARPSRACGPSRCSGPPRPGRKLVISGDTSPCETLAIAGHGADLLIHEATFAEEEHERAAETGHSTAAQAADARPGRRA